MAMAYPPNSNGDAGSPPRESRRRSRPSANYRTTNGSLGDPESPPGTTDRHDHPGSNPYTDPEWERIMSQDRHRKPESRRDEPEAQPPVATDRYGFLGGNQYTDPDAERRLPQEKLRKRETKWLDMFINWDKWMSKRFKKVKERCRKGVPPSLRARAWQHLCGSNYTMEQNKGVFEDYLRRPGDPKCIDDINKDLDRQFPLHEMFLSKGGVGQESLFEVLKAYSIHRPVEGYCQAQAPIAALLLMHMPVEQAFWCLVAICDKYLTGYYSLGLEAVQLDGDVLFGLLKKTSPSVHKHMRNQNIEPIMFMTEWFMCVFTRTLPWTVVLRLWDQFLCEGVKVLFRVGLVLLKTSLEGQEKLSQCPSFFDTLERLRFRKLPPELQDEEFIFRESLRLNITERDMEKEHLKQIKRRKAVKDKEAKEKDARMGSSGGSEVRRGPGPTDMRHKRRT